MSGITSTQARESRGAAGGPPLLTAAAVRVEAVDRPGLRLAATVARPSGALAPALSPLTPALASELAAAGVERVPVALGLGPDRVASPATRARAALVTRVMREQLPSDPAALAVSPDDGARGARALDAALVSAGWIAALAEVAPPGMFAPRWLEPALRTAALAGVVGAACGWDDEALVGLCCGALLADVGMLLLPPDVGRAGGAYGVVQRRLMQTHALRGAELLAPLAIVMPVLPLLALQHHERIDGNGYPSGLAGAAARPEAQVVAVCHRFLAAIRERAHRPALPRHDAYDLVLALGGALAAPFLIDAFARGVAVYPRGSPVRLSDGRAGVVVAPGASGRPVVEVRWDADGLPVEPHPVALADDRTVLVAHVTEPPPPARA